MNPLRLFATMGTGFLLSASLFGCQTSQSTTEQNAQTNPPVNSEVSATDSDSMASTLRNPAESKTDTSDSIVKDTTAAAKTTIDKTADKTATDKTTTKTTTTTKTNTTIPAKTPPTVPKVPAVQGIAITTKGFSPSSITIAPGTKIIFSNLDDAKHWPASDNHPSHKLCPGFDSLKPLSKNQTYEFTFTKAAVCRFHDHLKPDWQGTIIVK